MDVISIEAKPRDTGKKASRAARREGMVPCVLYGKESDNVHFVMEDLALHRLVFTDELHRLSVKLEGKDYDCILKSVDMHPVSNLPIHADFQALVAGQTIELAVPISFVGTAVGQTNGGDVQNIIHELTVACLPINIPDSLSVDITHLDIGDSIHVSDLEFENIEIVTPPQQTVVSVTAKRVEVEEPTEGELLEGEEGVAVEGEGGEAAAEGEAGDSSE